MKAGRILTSILTPRAINTLEQTSGGNKVRLFLVLALLCSCISGCKRARYLEDISQVSYTEESGTILPELQLYERIVITRDRVTLSRNGKTPDTEINEGVWEFEVDEQKVTAFFEQLEAIDCSSIEKVEPDEPTLGGGTETYSIVYAGDEKFYLGYGQGTTYTNGRLIVDPIEAFIRSLEFPAGAASQYKEAVNQPTAVPPTPAPTVAPAATLEIINDSGADIWYVYLSPSSSDEWGDDQLGDTVIAAGESFTLTDIPFGTYDVKADGAGSNVIELWLDVEFDGPMTWTIVGSESLDTASLTIVNSSGVDIWYVYLSPSFSDEWGDDQLGDTVIAAGERFTLTSIPFNFYDVRAESADHVEIETRFNQPIDGPMTWEVWGSDGSGWIPRVDQWAISATASSEYGNPGWAASQATGAPDTLECGDYQTAWASLASDGVAWLEVGYETPVIPGRINVYETHSPGFIVQVQVLDEFGYYHTVWEGEPAPTDECPRVFSVPIIGIDVPVVAVRIHLDQSKGGDWNEIDAVELLGTEE
ncbi:MAG: hypothetical protein SXV54_24830 [Chloroflexota bacterium]|nr:hypothetical protein [Chloroflexota bacterium]